jgi:hypothetical protein
MKYNQRNTHIVNTTAKLEATYVYVKGIYSKARYKILQGGEYKTHFDRNIDHFKSFFKALVSEKEHEAIKSLQNLTPQMKDLAKTPNEISKLSELDRSLQLNECLKLRDSKYIVMQTEKKGRKEFGKVWIPICNGKNGFDEIMKKVIELEDSRVATLHLPFFEIVDSEVNLKGVMDASFDGDLFESIISSAKNFSSSSPTAMPPQPTMYFCLPPKFEKKRNAISDGLILIDFKNKVAFEALGDDEVKFTGIFNNELFEKLRECKQVPYQSHKTKLTVVSLKYNASADEIFELFRLYSSIFASNPNFMSYLKDVSLSRRKL